CVVVSSVSSVIVTFLCLQFHVLFFLFFFFFTDTATTEIYTLSLHDALPILSLELRYEVRKHGLEQRTAGAVLRDYVFVNLSDDGDRKSTRLNSSHVSISYAVFCLKKKKKKTHPPQQKTITQRNTNHFHQLQR